MVNIEIEEAGLVPTNERPQGSGNGESKPVIEKPEGSGNGESKPVIEGDPTRPVKPPENGDEDGA